MDNRCMEILGGAMTLFMTQSVKSVTMDQVAKSLQMSKKTLYKYVTDKKDLVKKTMEFAIQQDCCDVETVLDEHLNAIDALIKIDHVVSAKLEHVDKNRISELKQYYPEAWMVLHTHLNNYVYNCMLDNMKSGIEEGYYRKNIDPVIITRLYVYRMTDIFDALIFPEDEYTPSRIDKEYMRYHIHGIASEKGIKYIEEKFKQDNIL